jgi:glycine/D-amino acid oxidase-like deaminating enzyme
MATADLPECQPLSEKLTADVCIIGAGMAGMSTAYQLSREGKRVVLLDDGPPAGGETSRTTAHLTYYNDDGMSKVEQRHGFEGLKIATESHRAAVDRIEANVREERIDCDFQRLDAYLFVSSKGLGEDFLAAASSGIDHIAMGAARAD